MGLMFNGLLKVPMQFFILLVGVMVFVFYQFNPSPLNFIDKSTQTVLVSDYGDEYRLLQDKQADLFELKKKTSLQLAQPGGDEEASKMQLGALNILEKSYRLQSKFLIKKAVDPEYRTAYNTLQTEVHDLESDTESIAYLEKSAELDNLYKDAAKDTQTNDRDYMFIRFILNNLPTGLIGLLLAVILSAAMSSTASEINALATITSIDLYGRNQKEDKGDAHMVKMTKWFTFGWGIVAIIIACFANLAENLIQLVNIIGSIFYGNVLGIFLLAFFFKHIKGNAVFTAALITQVIVVVGWWFDWMPYLWLNLFGCVVVIFIANLLQPLLPKKLA